MRKYRIIYLMSLLTMTGLYMETNGKEALLFLLLLLVMPLFTGGMLLFGKKKVNVTFSAPISCVLGQDIEIPVCLTQKQGSFIGRIEILVSIENTLFGEKEEKIIALCPDIRSRSEYVLPFPTNQCGRVKICQTRRYLYDCLGLFRLKCECDAEQTIIIYPRTISLELLIKQRPRSIETGDVFDEINRGQDASETFDLREYQTGDSIRTIHWKLSGKMDELLVREFSRPANYSTIVLFDFVEKNEAKEELTQIINMTASLVTAVMNGLLQLNMGHQVGYMMQGQYTEFTVDSQDSFAQMVDRMMSLKVERKSAGTLNHFMRMGLYHRYTKVIYISKYFDENAVAELCNLINISVIVPWKGQEDYLVSSRGYEIWALSAKELEKNEIFLYI